ncbi:geranylgeranyl pyrophosphate synthetase [Ophidiomyces ophidiicola]|uniref:Geranylgeranyl pyrophosphate synthetase n=1 Tax=Ophidiomyces ophidiicola TaxID=1387563 RepID=A0ACB8V116_9EURO|nr:geranylgeranyl pyrophosphate synthetase [Ophidiomyces ophidiicola]KAI1905710.1 geranylgeranyl pyrophosphate synthetase [Ophidiomyces ophidiicola]KAI1906186.1 geranylgeranyl pyrophosphate synthetase [Ophidiomyces ophidiicola]KAI1920068.1 geranylgeranyl pyrophosphate synthetase [Ophidiomyces ophidiicola]KAI1948048.1 geranylgeranyl pyrophosphate synthetase [Ophidiomyces ophidiicola]KAI1948323.1 geranylgeranyl pyrophosphate synthetase [Ophidiomyces ophidiicola]
MPELSSPNPIPPRTSSTGVTNGASTWSINLKPVPEEEWISRKPTSPTQNGTARISSPKSTGASNTDAATICTTTMISNIDGMWSADKEKILLGPYEYMSHQPGKDIRRQLIAAFNRWLHVPEESLTIISKVVLMLHTASLLVDDVEDSSVLRRGVPVAHNIFGTAQTINSANYIYFLALAELQKLHNPDAIGIFTTELLNLHRGQGMDLFWRDTLTCPNEEDYLQMVGNKTGGLFRLAIKLMQAESSVTVDCIPLVNLMGLIFQICDDYLNLSNPTYSKNKGLCEDLTEGKFSFPVIHSIRSQPDNLQLINILKQKTQDEEVKRYAINYMESTGSFGYTRKTISRLRDKALTMIDELENTISGLQGPSGETSEGNGALVRSILNRIVEPALMP